MVELGKTLVVVGVVLIVAGAVVQLLGRAGGGWLPGDIVIERKSFTFFFPVVTCIVISVILTVLFNLFGKR